MTLWHYFPMTIREALAKKGWKPADLASKVGVDRSYIIRLMNGQRRPSPEVALAIERATNGMVTRMELLYPDDP